MPSRKSKKRTRPLKKDLYMERQMKAILVAGICVFLLAGLTFTEQTGFLGQALDLVFRVLLGDLALLFPFFLLAAASAHLWPREIKNLRKRLLGLLIIFLLITIIYHLNEARQDINGIAASELYSYMLWLGLGRSGGGVVGAVLSVGFYFLFRDLGSYIVSGVLVLIAFLLLTDSSLVHILEAFLKRLRFIFQVLFSRFLKPAGRGKSRTSAASPVRTFLDDGLPEIPEAGSETADPPGVLFTNDRKLPPGGAARAQAVLPEGPPAREQGRKEQAAQNEQGREKAGAPLQPVEILPGNPAGGDYAAYEHPPLELLTRVNPLRDQQQQKVTRERARALESTLASFGVKVKIKEVQTGPAVTRFVIQPETGVKVSKILSLSDDLALNLAASDVRIEAPIPGKQAIGIEVPNKIISLVYLREVLEGPDFYSLSSPLVAGLGKDITGIPVFADLLKMPHLLIAGSTGSGKSVCINAIICSILLKAHPRHVKLLLIDPKVVELNVYNGLPHLVAPVITEPKKASQALKNMTKEMERRYELFAREGVRDIARYNEFFAHHEEMEDNQLPFIVVLIDELSDLMMVAPSEVEDSIVRLSQMSRAAGIHLVIATQRPSVDVITGLIKANITSRIAFAVSSSTDSRTILDMGGAEKLLGSGDMLYYPTGSNKPQRIQGAFISEQDIFQVVEFIKQQNSPLTQQLTFETEEETARQQKEEMDPLLPEVLALILLAGQASISLIQRRFRVGYTRAARLMDDLERLGIVGQYEGSKPRQVLVGQERAAALLKEKFDVE